MKARRIVIEKAPMGITSNGAVLLNVGFVKDGNVDQLVKFIREIGGRVFVGLVVEGKYRDTLVRDIDDASFDMALRLGADVVKGKRAGTRKKASTTR
jgi:predicted lactoylglutathione lyase